MSITEIVSFDKEGRVVRDSLYQRLWLALVIVLVALLSFGIGRLSVVGDREPISIEYNPEIVQTAASVQSLTPAGTTVRAASAEATAGQVVGSKNGTKYHYAHCPGAKQIKEENKITFNTAQSAEAAGYTLAANCVPK